ncbi:hypothetical protein B0H13DRAFT_2084826 [Mycena leptocephala]|nr:hypothetical protein B0H13DRAFT_2084826 [Mycena leptocephala]
MYRPRHPSAFKCLPIHIIYAYLHPLQYSYLIRRASFFFSFDLIAIPTPHSSPPPPYFFPYDRPKNQPCQQLWRPVVSTSVLGMSSLLLDGHLRFWFHVVFVVMSVYTIFLLSGSDELFGPFLGPFAEAYTWLVLAVSGLPPFSKTRDLD